ncbi:5252_t:CDS:2 [Ambispora gerdemannii]|uniref:5252_t:CDS:1 n=1 Tax=Ambispora gerdemannii TaxID=144530 RepID=A0A9N9D8Q4_9GLOM|nr:5252_t:CDS:2 [Ambispora gerdemannii]
MFTNRIFIDLTDKVIERANKSSTSKPLPNIELSLNYKSPFNDKFLFNNESSFNYQSSINDKPSPNYEPLPYSPNDELLSNESSFNDELLFDNELLENNESEADMNNYIKIYTHLELNTNPKSTASTMKRANRPLSNYSNSRPIQKPSKKLGCKSYLRVLKCHNEKENSVQVIHYTSHNGHIPDTDEDLRHFCISQQAKKWIHARVKDGMQPSQIRRDMYLSYIDIYNIVNDEMKGVIFLGNKKEEYAIKNQNQEWKPHTFLTDCDNAQQNAIRTVYPGATILLCQWHIKNAWQKNKGKIKADSNHFAAQEKNKNNSNIFKRSGKQATQKVALDELGIIMRIRDTSQVQNTLIWILRAAIMDAQFECEAVHLMIGRMKSRQKEQQHHELAGLELDVFNLPGN